MNVGTSEGKSSVVIQGSELGGRRGSSLISRASSSAGGNAVFSAPGGKMSQENTHVQQAWRIKKRK